ncbi:tRNA (guanine-N(1)-)-methyltransferase [Planctomycetales bacterium]|nr:tRNA (guanine-N(1)-)-methyltransferase [Planctomycetales bacterium]
MRIDILTIFPEMLRGVFAESILKRAQDKEILRVYFHDIRAYSQNKHRKVDDRPFGGGPGMVMTCQPVVDAVRAVQAQAEAGRLIFMCPGGKKFSQTAAAELARASRLILVCGRYEGFDERIFTLLQPEIISIGDYVLSGGELAAAVLADAVTRLLPKVLGDEHSAAEDSFSLRNERGEPLLDYPHYAPPALYAGLAAPEILRGGNHAEINRWRREQAEQRTRERRPDLFRV